MTSGRTPVGVNKKISAILLPELENSYPVYMIRCRIDNSFDLKMSVMLAKGRSIQVTQLMLPFMFFASSGQSHLPLISQCKPKRNII